MEIKAFTSLESSGNFSGPKTDFKIKTVWIIEQFLAHKQVDVALLTDSLLYYWKTLILTANAANIKQLSGPEKFLVFREMGPGRSFY